MGARARTSHKVQNRSAGYRRMPKERPSEQTVPAASAGFWRGLAARLAAPVDIASLACFRICFGFLMLWLMLEYLVGGRLQRLYLTPVFLFKFTGFEWVQVGSPGVMRALFVAMAVLAAMIAVGLFYRAACILFLLGFCYVFLLDESVYQNHLYLVGLLIFLLAVVPAHRRLSLDVLRSRWLRAETAPAWSLWILRFQIAVPYVFGGIAKLNEDWLLRAQPMHLWLQEGADGGVRLPVLKQAWAGYAFSWGGALYDLSIVPLLLWRRTRIPAFLVTIGFHLTNRGLFEIGVFPWIMVAGTLLFFPPDWPRRLKLLRPAAPVRRPDGLPSRRGIGRVALTALGVYVALQVVLPVRHFLYPGPVDWTEEGHRFSWRMKLRDKRGELRFIARDPSTGQTYALNEIDALLSRFQHRMMIHDPDMIRQFAALLKQRLEQGGYKGIEIHAVTRISLNGRPPQPMVDPNVDLASLESSFGHATWIMPLESPRRP